MRRWVQNQFSELSPTDKASVIFNLMQSPSGKDFDETTDSNGNNTWKFPLDDDLLQQACMFIKERSPNVPPLPDDANEGVKRLKIDAM